VTAKEEMDPLKKEVRIVITGSKKGKATVEWHYETADGKVGGSQGIEVAFE
jgi:hypothetical protein